MHATPSLQSAASVPHSKRPSHGGHVSPHPSHHPSLFGTLEARKRARGTRHVVVLVIICHANIALRQF